MEKIDLNKIRGRYLESAYDEDGIIIQTGGGDDTIESIKLVAVKLNEVIDLLNSK